MKNYISVFEESRVTIERENDNSETVWYDITDIVKKLTGAKKSILEYVSKIEMDIYCFYPAKDYGKDKMNIIRDEFERRIKVDEYNRFQCTDEYGEIAAYNDAGEIRLTFNNGAVLVSTNSEWDGIELLQGTAVKGTIEDAHNELFMEEP
ncbi:MAG: hypothetical protein K6E47_17495 [Lachnospiraceae bacterium]|nr:hypothetical protein [Lachnospiraceae bacterium]